MTEKRQGISVDEAAHLMRLIAPKVRPHGVKLDKASGRTLAKPVVAGRDQPPFVASAMDGFAVCGEAQTYRLIGLSKAGHGFKDSLLEGQAVRIFTGAPVPDGATAVIVQERTKSNGDTIAHEGVIAPMAFMRRRGQDFSAGEVLLAAGRQLDPIALALVAAAGCEKVAVVRKPKIAVLCNGDELVGLGDTPRPDQIYESVSYALMAMIRNWGGKPAFIGMPKDDLQYITKALAKVKADLIITVGGASVGEHDLVKPALSALGLKMDFEGVEVRPGKPVWMGSLEDGRRVLGLPGNPASALVCAHLFLKPYIEAAYGCYQPQVFAKARLTDALAANGQRESYLRAAAAIDENAMLCVTPFADQDSSLIHVFVRANVLIRRLANTQALQAGDLVETMWLDKGVDSHVV
jgi:molybdopterin molybdotransferase